MRVSNITDKRQKFIDKALLVYGDKYDYSKVEYIDSKTKVCIICPEHGEFWQTPASHLRNMCPKCANMMRGVHYEKDGFVERAIAKHGDKYDYSKVEYIDSNTKICIICPEHGEFWQTPASHIAGRGCPKCVGKGLTHIEIVDRFKSVHGDKYDYSKVKYIDSNTKICIICPEHGEFWQTPSKHLNGQGCPKCGAERRAKQQFLNTYDFIRKATAVHGDRYDYSNVVYRSMRDKVEIICSKHGSFMQYPYDHINGHGCPTCGNNESNAEKEIASFIRENTEYGVIMNDRTLLDGKEIGILIPDLKVGIEYNGLLWHSEEYGKNSRYHLDKTEMANKKGYRLIHIFEDEYVNHKDIVLNKLSHILNIESKKERIMARKCNVSEIDSKTAKDFLDKNHIQGYGKSTVSVGCFYDDILVGVMSFIKEKDGWNLVRFATDYNYVCCGIGGKLLKTFIKEYDPDVIKTFADRRWTMFTDDNLYTKIGFVLDGVIKPDYRYIDPNNPKERIHKFNFRKKSIHKKYGIPMYITEREMCREIGLKRIYDCGLYKYVWKKKGVK